MKPYYSDGTNIIDSEFTDNRIDKLKSKQTFVSPAMLKYVFPIPLDEDIAKLYRLFDCCPWQLFTKVVLVYKHAKLLESVFGALFGFEETVRAFSITKTKYNWIVQKSNEHY